MPIEPNFREIGNYDGKDAPGLARQLALLEDNIEQALKNVAEDAVPLLVPTNLKTSNYVALLDELVACAGTFQVTLPVSSPQIQGHCVGVVVQSGTITVASVTGNVQGGASDVLTIAGEYLYVSDGVGWWRAPLTPAVVVPSAAVSVVTETAFGQASAVGVSSAYARQDHTHGTPTAPTALTPASSVTSGTSFGGAPAVGTSLNYARQDHDHGNPATPVTSAVAGTGIGVSGATGAVTISNTGVTSLATGNTNMTVSGATGAITATVLGALLRAPQVLTSGTSISHPTGTRWIRIRGVGGGGGGGGAAVAVSGTSATLGGGGASGGYVEHLFVAASSSSTYAIGTAGTAGAIGGAGGAGGNSTFTHNAVTVTANGGGGGATIAAAGTAAFASGGARPAISTGGTLNGSGAPGESGYRGSGAVNDAGAGNGASSPFGGGGLGSAAQGAGAAAIGFGSGGAGGLSAGATGFTGGAGSAGVWIVEEYS